MDKQVEQLVEMGATLAQARAALHQYKDVMEAAEKILEGKFDNVADDDDGDVSMPSATSSAQPSGMVTPDDASGEDNATVEDEGDDQDSDAAMDEDGDDYVDYDSDFGENVHTRVNADPYAGIFFSKSRREEIIEVEEEPEVVVIPHSQLQAKIMPLGLWMKGCSEGAEQTFLFQLYNELTEGVCKCPGSDCGNTIPRRKLDFFSILPDFNAFIAHLRQLVHKKCVKCGTEFCFACGESYAVDKTKRDVFAMDQDDLFHCSNFQGTILGMGLCMLEQMTSEQSERNASSLSDGDRSSKRRKTASSSSASQKSKLSSAVKSFMLEDDDMEYYMGAPKGKKANRGTGYAGDGKEDNSGEMAARAQQLAKDTHVATLLSQIRKYLPSLNRKGGSRASDYLVHPTTLAHLRRRFNVLSSTLLRNDSLADMSERSVLYFELLEWLETISNHEALASMMGMPIMVQTGIKSVTTRKSPTGQKSPLRERCIIYEGSSGPRELLESIAIQARAALKGLESTRPPEPSPDELTEEQKRMTLDPKGKGKATRSELSEENAKLLRFCQRIISTVDAIDRSLRETKGDVFMKRLHDSLPKVFTSSTAAESQAVKASATLEETMKVYTQWASRVRFEYCDLTIPSDVAVEGATPSYMHYFNAEARALQNSDLPKRQLAIAKELATLTTNLPVAWDSSIFLRVDETRVDVIKALITGPEGTPFLFDIFLGAGYNQSPPSVKYMTTNGGKFRFNPNLYADGKVCLSLLGTWQGPGWIAGRSTLLQVLISIQSMILNDEPYLNEPGWASSGGTPQSIACELNFYPMLGNLKKPPAPFEEVIRTHFRLKAKAIVAQLDDWLSKDNAQPITPDGFVSQGVPVIGRQGNSARGEEFAKDVAELKLLLAKL
ncbi:hypothetical protein FISHEDRAFT_65234 [Fistulina hepatica ATCC 64428]|nr:hypothetical protein FISHEDRAFT_65234 [Fistulina hepatica ATCC 64428]